MNVAITGDRSTCLAHEVTPGAYVVAIARGFGTFDGRPASGAALAHLRGELHRRLRGSRLERAHRRPRGVLRVLAAGYGRVNSEIHAGSASNDDYVTAGTSLTAAVVTAGYTYLAHTGTTAAYLLRGGSVVALTKDDAIDTPAGRVLTRAIGTAASVNVALSSFTLNDGDALILACRRYTPQEERECRWERDNALIVRYTEEQPAAVPTPRGSTLGLAARTLAATMAFFALLCLH